MAKSSKKQKPRVIMVSDFQLKYEKYLQFAALALGIVHITLVPFRYAFDYKVIRPFERWFGFLLVLAVVIYLFLTRIRFPGTWNRVQVLIKRLSGYEIYYAAGLLIWFILSCWHYQSVTKQTYFRFHDWYLFDMAINIMIFLPMAIFLGKSKSKKIIELIIHFVVGAYSIFTLWCLWNVFRLNIVTLPSGGQVGMDLKTRLYFGCHYNITGAIALTMLALCLYMMFTQKLALKIIYIVAGISHLLVVMLSNSRTVFVAGLVMTVAAAFMVCWNHFMDKDIGARVGISLVCAAFFGGLFWMLRPLTFMLFEKITHFKELIGSNTAISEDVRELTNLSGRLKIWIASLKVMFSSAEAFFFGVTSAGTTSALMQIGGITFEVAHAHNAILQVGVAFGVPAMIGFVVFLWIIMQKSLRILFSKSGVLFKYAYMVPIVVLCLVVMNLAEAYLVGYYAIMSSVFFLFCGWIIELDNE